MKKCPEKKFSCFCFPEQWGFQVRAWELCLDSLPCHRETRVPKRRGTGLQDSP